MRNYKLRLAAALITILVAGALQAHPGAAIAVAKDGVVYFVDTGGGVFSIQPDGRVVRREGPAFHWFAFDPGSRFQKTPWPSLRDAEFRSAGVDPTIILSSDFPVTLGSDGKFYYPDKSSGDRIRLLAIDPSGARSTLATLPPIRRGAETVLWLNGLAAGADGSLYYTEDRAIRKVDRRGHVSTIAENIAVEQCAAIPGIEADDPYLRGLAVASDGSIYVAATGCGAVVKVDRKGRVHPFMRVEPPWSPTAVAVSGDAIYVLEYLHTPGDNRAEWLPRVRKVTQSGAMTILGGVTRK